METCKDSILLLLSEDKHISDELSKKDRNNLQKARDSNIAWLDDRWIYKEILPFIEEANKKTNWNFDIDVTQKVFNLLNITLNQHYSWHCDSYPESF
jgi:hypothetical protein